MTISGKVVRGSGSSSKIGFPTANINLRHKIPIGIFAAVAQIDKKEHKGILVVGAPTKHKRKYPKIEFYCFSQKKCRGKKIKIELLKKIRPVKIFLSKGRLVEQIKKDVITAKKYFKKHG